MINLPIILPKLKALVANVNCLTSSCRDRLFFIEKKGAIWVRHTEIKDEAKDPRHKVKQNKVVRVCDLIS